MNDQTKLPALETPQSGAAVKREDDALYQESRLVARTLGAEIDMDAREVHFREVYNSDDLILPEECEFQKYRLMIQRIADASRIDKQFPEKGRVLKGVVAEILGYREQ